MRTLDGGVFHRKHVVGNVSPFFRLGTEKWNWLMFVFWQNANKTINFLSKLNAKAKNCTHFFSVGTEKKLKRLGAFCAAERHFNIIEKITSRGAYEFRACADSV